MKPSKPGMTMALLLLGTTMGPQALEAQEPPTVPPGHPSVAPEGIRPHRTVWRLLGADGNEQGIALRETDRVTHLPNEPAIFVSFRLEFPRRSALDVSYLDAETLLPFARYVTSSNGFRVHYQSGRELVASYTRREGGEPQSIEVPLSPGRFNGGVVDLVLASLPLESGFVAELPILGASGGRDALGQTMKAEVTRRETLRLPDGREAVAWRVRLDRDPGRTQVVYISKEMPYLLRREVLDDGGGVLQTWELRESTF